MSSEVRDLYKTNSHSSLLVVECGGRGLSEPLALVVISLAQPKSAAGWWVNEDFPSEWHMKNYICKLLVHRFGFILLIFHRRVSLWLFVDDNNRDFNLCFLLLFFRIFSENRIEVLSYVFTSKNLYLFIYFYRQQLFIWKETFVCFGVYCSRKTNEMPSTNGDTRVPHRGRGLTSPYRLRPGRSISDFSCHHKGKWKFGPVHIAGFPRSGVFIAHGHMGSFVLSPARAISGTDRKPFTLQPFFP